MTKLIGEPVEAHTSRDSMLTASIEWLKLLAGGENAPDQVKNSSYVKVLYSSPQ